MAKKKRITYNFKSKGKGDDFNELPVVLANYVMRSGIFDTSKWSWTAAKFDPITDSLTLELEEIPPPPPPPKEKNKKIVPPSETPSDVSPGASRG